MKDLRRTWISPAQQADRSISGYSDALRGSCLLYYNLFVVAVTIGVVGASDEATGEVETGAG